MIDFSDGEETTTTTARRPPSPPPRIGMAPPTIITTSKKSKHPATTTSHAQPESMPNLFDKTVLGGKDAPTMMVVNSEADLSIKMKDLKREHKQQRAQRKEQKSSADREMTENQNIFSRLQNNEPIDARPVLPVTAAQKMAYGRVKMQGPNMPHEELAIQDPFMALVNADEIDEVEARKSQITYSETLGMENFHEHFISADKFLEKPNGPDNDHGKKVAKRETITEAARRLGNEKLREVTGGDDEEDEGRAARLPVKNKRGKKRATSEEPKNKRQHKKSKLAIEEGVSNEEKAAVAAPPMEPLTRNETAVVDYSNMRDMTANEVQVAVQISNTDIKPKPQRFRSLVPTETAPSGNDAVRAIRRQYLTSHSLNAEAEKSSALHDETSVRDATGGLHLDSDKIDAMDIDTLETPGLCALETRDIAVIDNAFYDDKNEAQLRFMGVGDRNAIAMANERRRPSKLPQKPIASVGDRETENGRERESLSIAMEAARNTAAYEISDADKVQPLFCYVRDHTKPSVIEWMGWVENIVFDNKKLISSILGTVRQYKTVIEFDRSKKMDPLLIYERGGFLDVEKEQDAEGLIPLIVNVTIDVNKETGRKILSDDARQLARNLKKRRDPVGRQAEFDPTRLRMHIAHHKVAFCLTRWNKRDAMFINDWPDFVGGNLVEREKPETAIPDRRRLKHPSEDPQAFIRLCEYGAIGRMLNRCREQINARNGKTGYNHLVSVEELGTDRLHPSVNPSIPRETLDFHLSQMHQVMEGEEPCIEGEHCICNTSNTSRTDNSTYFTTTNTLGFICTQRLSEREMLIFKTEGRLPKNRRQCYPCYMASRTSLYFDNLSREVQPVKPIHDFCVYTDGPGQYSSERCLPLTVMKCGRQILTGIVDTFPQFELSDYVFDVRKESDGTFVRFLRPNPAKLDF